MNHWALLIGIINSQMGILGENLQAICYLTEGKIIKLENEYLIRQFHGANNYHNINKTKWLENTRLKNALSLIINYAKSKNESKYSEKIEKLLNEYFRKIILNLSISKKTSFFRNLKKNLPINFIKYVKFLFFDSKNVKKFKKIKEISTYFKIVEQKSYE